jgi:hypothetical protein
MLLFARRACIYHFGLAEGLKMIIERMKINCSPMLRRREIEHVTDGGAGES